MSPSLRLPSPSLSSSLGLDSLDYASSLGSLFLLIPRLAVKDGEFRDNPQRASVILPSLSLSLALFCCHCLFFSINLYVSLFASLSDLYPFSVSLPSPLLCSIFSLSLTFPPSFPLTLPPLLALSPSLPFSLSLPLSPPSSLPLSSLSPSLSPTDSLPLSPHLPSASTLSALSPLLIPFLPISLFLPINTLSPSFSPLPLSPTSISPLPPSLPPSISSLPLCLL